MNPYAPPEANLTTPIPECRYYVAENALVCFEGAVLPRLCVKTGQPVSPEKMKKKSFIFSGFSVTGKKVRITFGLAADQIRKRRILFFAFLITFLTSISAIIFCTSQGIWTCVFVALAGIVVSFFLAGLSTSFLKVTKITPEGGFVIHGFSPAFLSTIQK